MTQWHHWHRLSILKKIRKLTDTNYQIVTIRYRTHQILNLSGTELIRYWTYLILNSLDTEHVIYWTYQLPNFLSPSMGGTLMCPRKNHHSARLPQNVLGGLMVVSGWEGDRWPHFVVNFATGCAEGAGGPRELEGGEDLFRYPFCHRIGDWIRLGVISEFEWRVGYRAKTKGPVSPVDSSVSDWVGIVKV
jgi:hypothetical protein